MLSALVKQKAPEEPTEALEILIHPGQRGGSHKQQGAIDLQGPAASLPSSLLWTSRTAGQDGDAFCTAVLDVGALPLHIEPGDAAVSSRGLCLLQGGLNEKPDPQIMIRRKVCPNLELHLLAAAL